MCVYYLNQINVNFLFNLKFYDFWKIVCNIINMKYILLKFDSSNINKNQLIRINQSINRISCDFQVLLTTLFVTLNSKF